MAILEVILPAALVCWLLVRPLSAHDIQGLRKIVCWFFLYSCVRYVVEPHVSILYTIHKSSPLLPTFRNFVTIGLYGVFPIVCGIAWWTIWRRKSSARSWGIAASLMNISVIVPPIIFVPHYAPWRHLGALVIGVVGLIGFLPQQHSEAPTQAIPDGNTRLKLS